jgi:hypothetical protein
VGGSRPQISSEQFVFASAISGAYASAAVALLFLGLDTLQGSPLQTPSLMGSVFLLGETPSATLDVRLDMVALYSLVHFLAFVALGALTTFVYARWEPMQLHALVPAGSIMAFLMAAAVGLDVLVAPGILAAVGPGAVAVGNAVAAAVMGWLIHAAVEPRPRVLSVFAKGHGRGSG